MAPFWPDEFDTELYGLDFGYTNPSALTYIGIKDEEIYTKEIIYERRLTNSDLIELMKSLDVSQNIEIYADSAEPDRIEEIYLAGFNIYPGYKGVKDGIDTLKRHKVWTHKDSVNGQKEVRNYKWKKKRNEGDDEPEEPVKAFDHFMDSVRYAVASFYRSVGSSGEAVII